MTRTKMAWWPRMFREVHDAYGMDINADNETCDKVKA
jgi:hypothetical protein